MSLVTAETIFDADNGGGIEHPYTVNSMEQVVSAIVMNKVGLKRNSFFKNKKQLNRFNKKFL